MDIQEVYHVLMHKSEFFPHYVPVQKFSFLNKLFFICLPFFYGNIDLKTVYGSSFLQNITQSFWNLKIMSQGVKVSRYNQKFEVSGC